MDRRLGNPRNKIKSSLLHQLSSITSVTEQCLPDKSLESFNSTGISILKIFVLLNLLKIPCVATRIIGIITFYRPKAEVDFPVCSSFTSSLVPEVVTYMPILPNVSTPQPQSCHKI
ncbi:hypothetical protein H2248_003379 [Termitomyces sp. 'cryptogamus']|nr:hypothetical protein H2248_003379 [Termitomyces sp. 'cryptogamus']